MSGWTSEGTLGGLFRKMDSYNRMGSSERGTMDELIEGVEKVCNEFSGSVGRDL